MKKSSSIIIFLLITASSIFFQLFPHYFAWQKTPINYMFTNQASWFDPWDLNVYVAAIQNGKQGRVLLNNLYTTQSGWPSLMYPLYTLSGLIFNHTNPWTIYYGLSIITSLTLCASIFLVAKTISQKTNLSLWILFFCAFGGGLGWLFPSSLSADLSITGFTFYSAFQRPHEAIGLSLYMIALVSLLKDLSFSKRTSHLISFFILLGLIIFYPYYLLSYLFIGLIFKMVSHQKISKTKIASFIPPAILAGFYYFHLSQTGFSSLSTQVLSKVSIISLLLGYGLGLPIFLYISYQKRHRKIYQFLASWFFVSVFMSFLPLGISRFFLKTLFLPIIAGMIKFLSEIISKKSPQIFTMVMIILTMILTPSFGYIFSQQLSAAGKLNEWIYLPSGVTQITNIINQDNQNNIMAPYAIANYIPAQTGKSVYFGHLIQTPSANLKLQKQNSFFQNKYSQEEARQFVDENKIKVVIINKTQDKENPNYSFLKPVYKDDNLIMSYVED